MSVLVLDPGLSSRIVDLGRPRSRSLGVPVGGAADRRSLILGNSLIGNITDAAALEIALKGPRLRANADVGCVLFGAPFEVQRDGYPIEVGHAVTLPAGAELHIRGTRLGMRAYLCVRGGFDAAPILDSRSSLDVVRAGDVMTCLPSRVKGRFCPDAQSTWQDIQVVNVLPGLQANWFDEAEFYQRSFTVTPASNRMGLRLQGQPLTMPEREMISEPVCPGSVQVTRDGQCIILGVDGQTIGGYPKIAQVIQADLDTLGQLRPGQAITFCKVSMNDAVRLDREAAANLRHWAMRLRLSVAAFSFPS